MKQILYTLSLVLLLTSCSSGETKDIYKTKSGLYGSRNGEFLIQFPGEPQFTTQHYQAGPIEYDENVFQYKVGTDRVYHVSYLDYPPQLLKAWDIDQLFDQSIKNFTSTISDFKILERIDNSTEKDYDKIINNLKKIGVYQTKIIND